MQLPVSKERLVHTGSKLSIHIIVGNFKRELEAIKNLNAYIGTIDENGSIETEISEYDGDIVQAHTIMASRKPLRRLQEGVLTMLHDILTVKIKWISANTALSQETIQTVLLIIFNGCLHIYH